MQPDQQQRIMGYFIEEAKDHLNTIEQGLLNLQSTLEDSEMVNEVFRAAHSVKGGAAMLGLNSIQRVGHRLEDVFKLLKETPVKVDQKLENLLFKTFDALQELLGQLQGPFGLTDEASKTILAAVEPTFEELEQHLTQLAGATGSTPQPAAAPVSTYIIPVSQLEDALIQILRTDVPARLRDMLQLFKQPETDAATRQQLQELCRSLGSIGEQYNLPAWCHLLETARRAIAHSDNSYRILAPIVIKDIKLAQELVLANRQPEVAPCTQLQDLAPVAAPVETMIQDNLDDLLAGLDDDLQEPIVVIELPLEDSIATNAFDFGGGFDATLVEAELEIHQGPEVGMEELNSLADLFEGEVPDLGLTWQQEEVADGSEFLAADAELNDQPESGDFSDLLFDQPTSQSPNLLEDNLNDLFGDDLFEQPSTSSLPVNENAFTAEAELDDFEDLLQITGAESSASSASADLDALTFHLQDDSSLELNQEQLDEFLILDPTIAPLNDAESLTADDGLDNLSLFGDSNEDDRAASPPPPASIADPWDEGTANELELDLADLALGDLDAGTTMTSDLSAIDDLNIDHLTSSEPDGVELVELLDDGLNDSLESLLSADDVFGLDAADFELDLSSSEESQPAIASVNSSDTPAAPILDPWSDDTASAIPVPDASSTDLEHLESVEVLPLDDLDLADLGFDEASNDLFDLQAEPIENAQLTESRADETPDALFDDPLFAVTEPLSEAGFEDVDLSAALNLEDLSAETLTDADASAQDLEDLFGTSDEVDASTDDAILFELSSDIAVDDDPLDLNGDTIAAPLSGDDLFGVEQFGTEQLVTEDSSFDDLDDLFAPAQNTVELADDSTELDSLLDDAFAESGVAESSSSLLDDSLLELGEGSDDLLAETESSIAPSVPDLDNLLDFSSEDESGLAELNGLAADDTAVNSEIMAELGSFLEDTTSNSSIDDLFGDLPASDASADFSATSDLDDLNNEFSSEDLFASDIETTQTLPELELDDLLEETPVQATGSSAALPFSDSTSIVDQIDEADLDDLMVDQPVAADNFGDLDDLLGDSTADAQPTLVDRFDTEPVTADSFDDLDDLFGDNTSAVEPVATDNFGDLDDLLGDGTADAQPTLVDRFDAEPVATNDFDDLDDLLGDDLLGDDTSNAELDVTSAFTDLDDLLGDEDVSTFDTTALNDFAQLDNLLDAGNTTDAFTDLDDLLVEDVIVTEDTEALPLAGDTTNLVDSSDQADNFSDLEALLESNVSPAIAPDANSEISLVGESEFDDLDDLLKEAEEKMGGSPSIKAARGVAPQARRTPRPGRVFSEQTMRVPVKHLDNLSNLVGELVVNRNSLEQDQERLRQSLDNLLYQVQQLSDVGQRMQDLYERSLLESSLLASRQGHRLSMMAIGGREATVVESGANDSTGIEYDPLEMDRFTGFHSLSQEMIELIVRVRESSSDIEFIVDETEQVTRMFRQVTTQLQEGLTRSRMVPFAQTADRLPRAVRDISIKVGKQAELVIEGRETLIDKMILEQLYDPMTHLVNNAITHGIESPSVRLAAGKSPAGRITVRAFHQGNQTIISVSDDGAGIDVDRVKTKAIEKGLITSAEARVISRLDVYDILFHPGFSTKDQADDFSGRGVGMDVVRTSLSEIRGVINTDSNPGKGTTFTIRLPLTLSISKALCCISDRARIAFPMDGVEDMLDLPKDRIQTDAEGHPCIAWRDTVLAVRPLSELLGYNRYLSRGNVYGGNQEDDIVSVVVLRSAGNFLALQVDQVLGEQEIVIKQLEGPVPKPIGVAGATVLGDGRIMPIADVLELIDLSMGRIRRDAGGSLWEQDGVTAIPEAPAAKTEPMVLIVDDSITVRELLSMTFNKVGYRVEQARDGQEAWEKLRSGLPCDLVFCDIEMPRMDGLELLSRIQKDANLKHLPIAMLTSRGADRHRQMASSLGASGYFTKPYLEEALLDAAQRMLKGERLLSS